MSITAGCGAVQPWEACLIAVVGAFVYVGASLNCDEQIKVDDVVDEQSYGGSKLGVKSAKSHEPIILIASIIAIVTLAPVLLLASYPLLPSFFLPSSSFILPSSSILLLPSSFNATQIHVAFHNMSSLDCIAGC